MLLYGCNYAEVVKKGRKSKAMSDVTKAELMQYVERVYILEKLKYEQTILYNQLASNVRNLKNQNTTPV